MKMKLLIYSLLLLFFQVDLSAQKKNHAISLSGGLLASRMTPVTTYPGLKVENNTGRGIGTMLGLQLSQKVYKSFWLNLEGGFMRATATVDFEIFPNLSRISYFGSYRINQGYIALEPELRLLKNELLFINLGAGVFADRVSEFSTGLSFGVSNSGDLKGTTLRREGYFGWYYGFGIRPRILKNFHFVLEARRMQFPSSREADIIPILELDYRNWSFIFGMGYDF